jgi:hypothetical protein
MRRTTGPGKEGGANIDKKMQRIEKRTDYKGKEVKEK